MNEPIDREKPDDKIKKLLQFENLEFENEDEQRNMEQMLIKIEDQEDVQALKNVSKEMLDEYEKENNELQFINDEVYTYNQVIYIGTCQRFIERYKTDE